jgi:hypothetical protein
MRLCGDRRYTYQSRHATLTGGTANFFRTTGFIVGVEADIAGVVGETESIAMVGVSGQENGARGCRRCRLQAQKF